LLNWYDAHARTLPWRVKDARQDPYLVWLSEIMLQQTTVAAVRDYFIHFSSRWPTVFDLARAPREDVLKAWAGLGYYARARNLHTCAQVIATQHAGRFPETRDELESLPGIGPYTSAAIAAIAFDLPVAAIDGNVDRVITRLHAITTPLQQAKPEIRRLAQAMVPEQRAGDFAQAMMDLGATICTPKSPSCEICPFTDQCEGRKQEIAATLPRKAPKAEIPTRRAHVYWLTTHKGDVLLRTRPDKGLLGGMSEIPSSEWTETLPRDAAPLAPIQTEWQRVPGQVTHTFTHFRLELTVHRACLPRVKLPDASFRLTPVDDLGGEALPSVMRKIVRHVLGSKAVSNPKS
jgi:A/G-specific adenine glycosylase